MRSTRPPMNYIDLVNQFWQLRREVPFTSVHADLYFYLLNTSNSLGWKNPFQQGNPIIMATLGISDKTLAKARAKLEAVGLIGFKSGVKGTHSTYLLKILPNNTEIFRDIRGESGGQSRGESGVNPSSNTKRKLNKTKEETANAVTECACEPGVDPQLDSSMHVEANNSLSAPGRESPLTGKKGRKSRATRPTPPPPPLDTRWPELVAGLDAEGQATWARFVAWEKENPLPKVFSMAEPLLPKQLVDLTNKHGSGEVTSILLDMQNRRTLHADYDSANLTVQAWLRLRKKREASLSS